MRETKVHSIKKISARWLILTLMKINDAAQGFPKTETALLPAPFWCIGTGPLRRALAGATRSGTAGVGHLLAIRGKRYAYPPTVL